MIQLLLPDTCINLSEEVPYEKIDCYLENGLKMIDFLHQHTE